MENNRFFNLFSCCQIVAGAKRALLLDTQREKYYLVPLGLKDLIDASIGREINEVLEELPMEQRQIAEEYIDFLINQECAFYCESAEEAACFPALDLHWDYPATITNAIIEVNDEQQIPHVQRFLQSHFIPCLEIALYFPIETASQLDTVIKLFSASNSKGLRILFRGTKSFDLPELRSICNQNPMVELLAVFASHKYRIDSEGGSTILLTPQTDFNPAHCGLIGKEHFNLSLNHFMESQTHNSCLNRKISIGRNGDIKNCPSMPDTFGNISSTTLEAILNHQDFKKYWTIAKDQVVGCKDCEFRYICTDCRAFTENHKDIYSKPLKCGYDPYINKWEDWSINPLKQAAISYYSDI